VTTTETTNAPYEVTAEGLSADGTHHVVVASAPLTSSGTFVLYPLSTATNAPTTYDLVIHGPVITTTIVKAVPVQGGSPSTATTVTLSGVSLTSANFFNVNLETALPTTARGSSIGFYQTLPLSGEVPYLIEQYPVDPLTGTYDTAPSLSSGNLQYGTYSSGTVSLSSATPNEGTATYHVAASSAVYGDGPLSTTVAAASTSGTTSLFTVAPFALPSGAIGASVAGTLSVAAPGKYDKGELILTENGALTAATPLDAYLASTTSSTTWFTSLPGGTSSTPFAPGLYYAEIWVWNSADPSGTFNRQPYIGVIDATAGSVSGLTLTVD
jgi:hypothetical protein